MPASHENKWFVEWKNSSFDWLTAQVKFQRLSMLAFGFEALFKRNAHNDTLLGLHGQYAFQPYSANIVFGIIKCKF